MIDISVIIVNYNSGDFLFNCIKGIIDNVHELSVEIIVVDNASTDDSLVVCKECPDFSKVKFIDAGGNIGFAKANNLATTFANGKVFHFLNPDTVVDETIEVSYQKAISNQDKVYVTLLRNPDGEIINKGHILPTLNYYTKSFFKLSQNKWYLGASVIMSQDIFQQIGKWSEDYFMYSEDLDLFYQIARLHIKTSMLPSVIYHAGGVCSSNKWNSKERNQVVNSSLRLFYKRNNIYWQYPIIRLIQYVYFKFKRT